MRGTERGSIIGSRLRIQFSAAPPFTATSRLFAYNDRLHWHFDDQLWVKRSTSLSSNTRAFRSMHALSVYVCVCVCVCVVKRDESVFSIIFVGGKLNLVVIKFKEKYFDTTSVNYDG